jgi:hypothetical protein
MAQTGGGATLLNDVTASGDGPALKVMQPIVIEALQAEISGAPAACIVNLLGLIDGSTFDTIATLDISQGYVSGGIVMLPLPVLVKQIKGNVGSLSGGIAPSVSLYVAWRN